MCKHAKYFTELRNNLCYVVAIANSNNMHTSFEVGMHFTLKVAIGVNKVAIRYYVCTVLK